MDLIRQLYQIEKSAEAMDDVQRRQYWQKHAVPVLKAFMLWLTEQLGIILPKSPLAQAIATSCAIGRL